MLQKQRSTVNAISSNVAAFTSRSSVDVTKHRHCHSRALSMAESLDRMARVAVCSRAVLAQERHSKMAQNAAALSVKHMNSGSCNAATVISTLSLLHFTVVSQLILLLSFPWPSQLAHN